MHKPPRPAKTKLKTLNFSFMAGSLPPGSQVVRAYKLTASPTIIASEQVAPQMFS